MEYTKDVDVNGQLYNYKFIIEGNSDYQVVVISKDGLTCGQWSDINYDDLGIVCQDIMDYIKIETPVKFSVFSETIELSEFYKSYCNQVSEFYTLRERELFIPTHFYACFYDRI